MNVIVNVNVNVKKTGGWFFSCSGGFFSCSGSRSGSSSPHPPPPCPFPRSVFLCDLRDLCVASCLGPPIPKSLDPLDPRTLDPLIP